MKKAALLCAGLMVMYAIGIHAEYENQGKKCNADIECGFGMTCTEGACVKKGEFDFGSSGKTGKPCEIDADCIGSGTCVEGTFGKKVCSGN